LERMCSPKNQLLYFHLYIMCRIRSSKAICGLKLSTFSEMDQKVLKDCQIYVDQENEPFFTNIYIYPKNQLLYFHLYIMCIWNL
jgi:hypothetical protein